MQTHTQLKVFFAAVLIALATLTIVTTPAQVMGAGQSKSAAVVASPRDARESGQARHPAVRGTDSADRIAASRIQTHDTRVLTPDNSLSFLPVVLLGLSAFLSQDVASEFASVVLIFTSQAWNLAFAWYQAQKTVPAELREVASNFHFSPWLRFRTVELPFAAISLVWNSVMSWAGGWFFLEQAYS